MNFKVIVMLNEYCAPNIINLNTNLYNLSSFGPLVFRHGGWIPSRGQKMSPQFLVLCVIVRGMSDPLITPTEQRLGHRSVWITTVVNWRGVVARFLQ